MSTVVELAGIYAGLPLAREEAIDRMLTVAPCDWWRFVGCGICAARAGEACMKGGASWPDPARRPHAPRRRLGLALHGTLWLLDNGFVGDVLGSES